LKKFEYNLFNVSGIIDINNSKKSNSENQKNQTNNKFTENNIDIFIPVLFYIFFVKFFFLIYNIVKIYILII